jgi:dipeptidyl aminopeptidase/acylaminoacyl peptidase
MKCVTSWRVDHVVEIGVADSARLGVGGWSYGGILTDYLVASDTRFKAATSGAGTASTVAFYGTDQYITQYDNEIGPPWDPKAWETYQKLSYPFLHAYRINTPTLFLGGERDMNVPIQGSERDRDAGGQQQVAGAENDVAARAGGVQIRARLRTCIPSWARMA